MKTLTVLDFYKGEIHIYQYENTIDNIEDLIIEKGHRINDCQWMCTDNLILQIHTPNE